MASRALATAFVNIVPGTKELEEYLKKQLPADAEKAGGPAGEKMGKSTGEGFGSKFKSVLGPIAATMAATFSVVAIGSFFKDGVQGANELNNSLAEVVSLTGTTGEEAAKNFSQFQGVVKDVSNEFGLAQDVLTNGLYNALSAGVPKENAFTFMQVASQAAIAGVTDVNTAVDGISTTINAFGLESGDAQAIADSMFTAVKGGKTTFGELSGALFNIAPAAAAAGVSFQEVNAGIAALTAGGTPTSVATTQMRAALQGLQKPSKDLDAIFQALGYQNAQLAIESEGLGFALTAVKDASGGSNGALQTLLGSSEAVSAVNVLAGTGAEKFAQELDNQANSAGAAQDALDVIDPQRALEKLNVGLDNMKLAVGTALLPVISELAAAFLPIVEELAPVFATLVTNLVDGFKNLYNWVSDNIPVIGTFVGVLGGLLIVFNAIKIATTAWSIAQGILNAIMAINPFTIIAVAIAALIAAIVYVATQTTFFQDTWKAVTAWFSTALPALGKFFSETWTNITGFVKTALGNIFEGAKTTLNNVTTFFKELPGKILTALGDFGKLLLNVGKDIIAGLINGLKNGALNIFGAVKDVANGITDGFKNLLGINSPSRVFQEFGVNIGQGLAKGIESQKKAVEKTATALGDSAKKGFAKPFKEIKEQVTAITNIPSLLKTTMNEVIELSISDIRRMAEEVEGFFALLDKSGKLLKSYSGFGVENLIPTVTGGQLDVGKLTDSLNSLQKAGYNNVAEAAFGGSTQQALDKILGQQTFINEQTGESKTISGNVTPEALERILGPGFTEVPSLDQSVEQLTDAINSLNSQVATKGLTPFARGGLVTGPTAALIGEAGPEVVTPLADFERMLGLGEDKGKTLIYHAAPNTSIDSEQALFQAMRRAKVVAAW
jgi:TP901 family phage tail tape measure protein